MFSKDLLSRRNFFVLAGATGVGLLAGCSKSVPPRAAATFTAIEALERQHGLTRRALAVMDKIRHGIDAQMDISPETAGGAVAIISDFMINCHQLMEEKFIFPVFAATKNTADLIAVLRQQHGAAFKLTDILKPLCAGLSQKDQENRRKTVNMIHLLTRMTLAHESWEDTALFPLLRVAVPGKSYEELSYEFEQAENQFLGQGGINRTLEKIAGFETILGMGNLGSFTPRPQDLS